MSSSTFVVSENNAPFVLSLGSLSGEEERVQLTFSMPRYHKLQPRKDMDSHVVDILKIDGSEPIHRVFTYGLDRFHRDGAKTQEEKKDKNGKVIKKGKKSVMVTMSQEDLETYALAHAEYRSNVLYGDETMSTRKDTIDPIVREYRAAVTSGIVTAKVKDPEGKAYKARTVPSEIAAGKTVSEVSNAARAIGIPQDWLDSKLAKANEVVAIRTDDLELTLELEVEEAK